MDHKTENTLGISWHDTAWVPHLNQGNILDYFSERSNPFYDRTCNNETIKMQRLNPEQMINMTGLEYSLLHAQEPILYVIRKQHRHSPTQVTPLADYYIIAGTVYQGPDLCTVVNSRLLNTLHSLQSAFDEAYKKQKRSLHSRVKIAPFTLTSPAQGYARFHPSKGYSWEFKEKEEKEPAAKDKKIKKKEEASSTFQRKRVDLLLGELAKKHPPLFMPPPAQPPVKAVHTEEVKVEVKAEKLEDKSTPVSNGSMRPPPEKKQKLR